MKLISALLVLSTFAVAEEIQQVSAEQAGKIARMVTAAFGSPTDAPFAVDADAGKPAGIKAGDSGLLQSLTKNSRPRSSPPRAAKSPRSACSGCATSFPP